MSGGRYVWRIVLQNFLKSFRPRQVFGDNMGKDYLGNVYYEIPANPSMGKRRPSRWYDPPKGNDFREAVPAEWESWLRMRRDDPPTDEEIARNLAMAAMKKENAAKLEAKRLADGGSVPRIPERGYQSFPAYPEYHTGINVDKKGSKYE